MVFTDCAWPPPPPFVPFSLFDFAALLPRAAVLFAPALLLVLLLGIPHRFPRDQQRSSRQTSSRRTCAHQLTAAARDIFSADLVNAQRTPLHPAPPPPTIAR